MFWPFSLWFKDREIVGFLLHPRKGCAIALRSWSGYGNVWKPLGRGEQAEQSELGLHPPVGDLGKSLIWLGCCWLWVTEFPVQMGSKNAEMCQLKFVLLRVEQVRGTY